MMLTTKRSRRVSAKAGAVATTALAVLLMAGGSAFAQAVVVQGNRRVDAETIRSYVVGQGAGSLEEARKAMLASGMFSSVNISRRGSQVVVSVVENNTINRVAFEGNKKVERVVLEQEVQTKARGPYNQAVVDSDIQRIREVYRRTGRALATVTSRVVQLDNGRIDVVYTIDEGEKTPVKEIRFVGNNAVSSSRLRNVMVTSEGSILSFFKSTDIYDPDRLAADQELIRRYYLKNGFADFQLLSTDVQFDAARSGYVITINVSEGEPYRIGAVNIDSRIPDIDTNVLRSRLGTSPGEVYNAEAVEKSLTNITTEVARRGYAFAQVRPIGTRDAATRTITLGYVIEEGPRVYIERINIRGNSRTRDYVVRREFELGEGDAYNKVLVDRAERRLNGLGYFKKVRISNEPGSAPDRVVVNVDVEDQPTGAFSVSGGYSTADGFIGEVAVTESNFLGRGQYVRVAGTYGQRVAGVDFSFTEPYFLGYRLAAGIDLFAKYSDLTQSSLYINRVYGGQLRLGLPVTEEFGVTLRYSAYGQKISIPNDEDQPYNDCNSPLAGFTPLNPDGTAAAYGGRDNGLPRNTRGTGCLENGEASVAIKEAAGTSVTSLAGVTMAYNTLDNPKNPRSGFYAELRPDVAGIGGDAQYFRVAGDARYYREIIEDVVGIARAQGGFITGFDNNLRIIDHFFLGPSLVRGFAVAGIGPKDISTPDSNALGGTTYLGGSGEVQFPLFGLPRELGLKGAVFADAGTLFNYDGTERFRFLNNGNTIAAPHLPSSKCRSVQKDNVQSNCIDVWDNNVIRSSVGASILWQSPLGPIRFDYAWALSKDEGVDVVVKTKRDGTVVTDRRGEDVTQAFRFSGGSRF